jgi:hypothetical protein
VAGDVGALAGPADMLRAVVQAVAAPRPGSRMPRAAQAVRLCGAGDGCEEMPLQLLAGPEAATGSGNHSGAAVTELTGSPMTGQPARADWMKSARYSRSRAASVHK